MYASLQKNIKQISDAIRTLGLKSSLLAVPASMCKHHYHLVYNSIHPTQFNCVTCGLSLRNSTSKLCPDPVTVTEHLRDNVGFQGSIRLNDKVCYPCYKSHLFILKQNKSQSTDRDLKELIDSIEQKIPTTIKSTSDLIEVAYHKVAAVVGRELLESNALLLPGVHDWFC